MALALNDDQHYVLHDAVVVAELKVEGDLVLLVLWSISTTPASWPNRS